jgi:hypothetical protein
MTCSCDPVLFWLALGVVLLIGLGAGLLIGQRGLRTAPLPPSEPLSDADRALLDEYTRVQMHQLEHELLKGARAWKRQQPEAPR